MKKILYFVSLLLLAGIVVVACKKDDDSTLPGANHTVTGFTPASGSIGTLVTVSGTNFTNQNISVNFNGVDATVSSVNISGKSLMVFVPEDAETGKISVTIDDVEVKSAANFTVTNEVTGPDAIELATQAMEMHTLDVAEFPEITNSDEFPAGSSIQIESNNPDIVDINGDGDLVALQAGGAEIEVTIAYENVELSATVNVDVEESIIVVGEKSSNATIWINDNLVNLGEDYLESSANSVHGNGSKTFVGGQIEEEGKDNIAAVWEFQPTGSFNLIKL
ncbi:MAG: IPT/TIG domain-containing protein, partial [Allomuricauda sp.]